MTRLSKSKEGDGAVAEGEEVDVLIEKQNNTKQKKQMGRERREVTSETYMSHTDELDTLRWNITFHSLSLSLPASHLYNLPLSLAGSREQI